MLFQTYYRIDPWSFDPVIDRVENVSLVEPSIRFRFHLIQHWVRGEDTEDQRELLAVAFQQSDLPEDIRAVFISGGSPAATKRDGHRFDSFPSDYVAAVRRIHGDLDSYATQALDLLSWRYALRGPIELRSELSFLRWRDCSWADLVAPFDPSWRQIPTGVYTLTLPEKRKLHPSDEEMKALSDSLASEERAPLGHNLLREAWRHLRTDRRSALVMAVAGAEIGFKECAADLLPQTRWLLEKLQAPPLMKMFKEFLPSFPARCTVNGAVRSLPKGINKRIQAAIEERNRIVHGSTGVVSTDLYADWLLAVQDLLYLLDYYRGHAWAWDLLSTGCKSGLSSAG